MTYKNLLVIIPIEAYKVGYEPGNVVTCCETCNRMKMALNELDFMNQIKKIYKHTLNVPRISINKKGDNKIAPKRAKPRIKNG